MSAPVTYRKTALVQAMQWTGNNIDAIWDWAGADKVYGPTETNPDWLLVRTLEGDLRCSLGDWVLRGPEGECWPVKASIFAATYEAVSETAEPETAAESDLNALLDQAWGVIANAGMKTGRGWDSEHPEWVNAAERWREAWFASMGQAPARVRTVEQIAAQQARSNAAADEGLAGALAVQP